LLVLNFNEVFGEFHDRHLLRRDFADDPAAVEDNQPVGDLVDVGEVVLDVDAGTPGALDSTNEINDFSDFGDTERSGCSSRTMRSAL
jgi:hypothetical protein